MNWISYLEGLKPATVDLVGTVIAAVATLVGIALTAVLGKVLSSAWLSARDRLDKETEWRSHAIELTKLDVQKKIERFKIDPSIQLRPSILDFLAIYRDLQELGSQSPKELYIQIIENRTKDIGRNRSGEDVGET